MSTAVFQSPFFNGHPPKWASGYGQDKYGYFAEFSLATGPHYWQTLTQRMRWIPAGTFTMGSPKGEADNDDETQHEVTLSCGYWLADTVCTQALWKVVTGENASRFESDDDVLSEDLPVERVRFEDVQRFINQLNDRLGNETTFSLPTEAQWEYACRAGTDTPFSFGNTISTDQANFNGNRPMDGSPKGEFRNKAVAVKSFPRNPWGLYQMHGNVWEWCSDWYANYLQDDVTDPEGPESGSFRVVRGGSWINDARYVRSACRTWDVPGDRIGNLGFRLLSSAS